MPDTCSCKGPQREKLRGWAGVLSQVGEGHVCYISLLSFGMLESLKALSMQWYFKEVILAACGESDGEGSEGTQGDQSGRPCNRSKEGWASVTGKTPAQETRFIQPPCVERLLGVTCWTNKPGDGRGLGLGAHLYVLQEALRPERATEEEEGEAEARMRLLSAPPTALLPSHR